jgi:hypothetical protein
MSLAACTLSDEELIVKIEALAAAERRATASLIEHLAELEARRLHLAYGFKSLFGYCRHVLHSSEAEAYSRMVVVHAARRFPVILPMLAGGLLHLTAVRLLAPHLEGEDHLPLLGGAIHKSRREVVKLVARWFPSADVPSSVRKLPTPAAPQPPLVHVDASAPPLDLPRPAASAVQPRGPAPSRAVVAPLSADRYRLQVTLTEDAHEDLRTLQDLLRREIPNGDAAAIVTRALKVLRREAEKKACSATSRPRPAREPAAATRDIPAHVERAVWQRDQGQCSFEGHARRCEERSFLEYHHLTPWIVGGAPSVENIALRCSAHNKYEADVYFAPIRAAREARESALVPGPVP